jgi:hypothetical protein
VVVGPGTPAPVSFVLGLKLEPHSPVNGCSLGGLGPEDPVEQACRAGGVKRAKATMKAMQKTGKELGLKFECDDCHRDESAGIWTLNRDAWEKYEKLRAVQSPRPSR